MTRSVLLGCLAATLPLIACGSKPDQGSGDAESEVQAAKQVAEALLKSESDPNACGQGGTACPEGLECLTWPNGEQACGPMAFEGMVLITDATLGGSCLVQNNIDKLPGVSIASVQVTATDGSVKGWGRLVWDQPGFAVATQRGTPPDGTAFSGDACATSYNLGCDGKAVFEIVDESGQAQKLREGQTLIVYIRGAETCGDEVEDGLEAALCTDPGAASGGALDSCSWEVRLVELDDKEYGPDRFGGTLGNSGQRR